jgi:hypothetical protein
VKGTASYERAETNTKWQMIFGLILVVAVVLAVIVMVSTSLDGSDQPSNPVITAPTVTDYVPTVEAAPTPSPTPTPAAESIRIMYYNDEKTSDFQMREGDDPIPLTAIVLPATLENPVVTWTCSDTTGEYCVVTTTGDTSCEVSIVKALAGGVQLTATCGGASKTITVYLAEAK